MHAKRGDETSERAEYSYLSFLPFAGQLQQDLALPAQDGFLPLQAAFFSFRHLSPGSLVLRLKSTVVIMSSGIRHMLRCQIVLLT